MKNGWNNVNARLVCNDSDVKEAADVCLIVGAIGKICWDFDE